jgi:holo-[acyl-carrier protein] synthase
MIIGIGLDVVELDRLAHIMAQPIGVRFAARVLTAWERTHWESLPPRRALEFIAGRFAAKEAVVKALGCGIGAKVGFHDIEIVPDGNGKPTCRLAEAAWGRLGWQSDRHRLHVAITHERNLAAANAVLERISSN